MTPEQYIEAVRGTMTYPKDCKYPEIGLIGECGELANKIKKQFRDKIFDVPGIKAELGDILWYTFAMVSDYKINLPSFDGYWHTWEPCRHWALQDLTLDICDAAMYYIHRKSTISLKLFIHHLAEFAWSHNWSLEQVAEANVQKLLDRQGRGVLGGNGDLR